MKISAKSCREKVIFLLGGLAQGTLSFTREKWIKFAFENVYFIYYLKVINRWFCGEDSSIAVWLVSISQQHLRHLVSMVTSSEICRVAARFNPKPAVNNLKLCIRVSFVFQTGIFECHIANAGFQLPIMFSKSFSVILGPLRWEMRQ